MYNYIIMLGLHGLAVSPNELWDKMVNVFISQLSYILLDIQNTGTEMALSYAGVNVYSIVVGEGGGHDCSILL